MRILLPVAYAAASIVVLFVFSGAGHGPGTAIFYYMSLPWAFLIPDSDFGALLLFILCLLQYVVVGQLLDCSFRKRKK